MLPSPAKPARIPRMTTTAPYTGQSILRFEDERLLRGDGTFIADMTLPDMAHAAIVRHFDDRAVPLDDSCEHYSMSRPLGARANPRPRGSAGPGETLRYWAAASSRRRLLSLSM